MATSYCSNCGNQLQERIGFCRNCGANNSPRGWRYTQRRDRCPVCASEVDRGRAFCVACGQVYTAPVGTKVAEYRRRITAYLIDVLLYLLTGVLSIIAWRAIYGLPINFDILDTLPYLTTGILPYLITEISDLITAWSYFGLTVSTSGGLIGLIAWPLSAIAIGYVIWWLIALRWGQTPGKQLLGIRVIRADGTASDWVWTFLREFAIKGIAVSLLNSLIFLFLSLPIITFLDPAWAIRDKKRQALHDKIMNTIVVYDRDAVNILRVGQAST